MQRKIILMILTVFVLSAFAQDNVKYGMKLRKIEKDTVAIDPNPNVVKRLMTQTERTMQEDGSYARLTEKTNKAIVDTLRDSANIKHAPHLIGWVGGNFYRKVDNYNNGNEGRSLIREIHRDDINTNFGFGLLFPITKWFGIKGEVSYMNILYADSLEGYRNEKYCALKERATLTLPVSANFMIRPKKLLFDMFAGASFLGINEDVFAFTGAALGCKVGKNGYLFADSRFAVSEGEKYWSVGIGYEFIPPYSKSGKKKHSIVSSPRTFTIISQVNDTAGGQIVPLGEFKLKKGSDINFIMEANERYMLDSLIVNDTIMTGEINKYSFVNITNNISITAMFDLIPESDYEPEIIEYIEEAEIISDSPDDTLIEVIKDVEKVKKLKEIQKVISFKSDSAKLAVNLEESLDKNLAVLQEEPDKITEITGQTDESGKRGINIKLPQNITQVAAQAAVDYLIDAKKSIIRLFTGGKNEKK